MVQGIGKWARPLFQLRNPPLQGLDLGPGACQQGGLDLELFAAHQVHTGKGTLQDGAEVALQVLLKIAQPGGHRGRQALGQFVEGLGIDHELTSMARLYAIRAISGQCKTTVKETVKN